MFGRAVWRWCSGKYEEWRSDSRGTGSADADRRGGIVELGETEMGREGVKGKGDVDT
jgi:hypothetical protein